MCALAFGFEFFQFFSELPDPRQQAKVLYPLEEIILTTLCGVICGFYCPGSADRVYISIKRSLKKAHGPRIIGASKSRTGNRF